MWAVGHSWNANSWRVGGLGAFSSWWDIRYVIIVLVGSSLYEASFCVTAFCLRPVKEKWGGTQRNT